MLFECEFAKSVLLAVGIQAFISIIPNDRVLDVVKQSFWYVHKRAKCLSGTLLLEFTESTG